MLRLAATFIPVGAAFIPLGAAWILLDRFFFRHGSVEGAMGMMTLKKTLAAIIGARKSPKTKAVGRVMKRHRLMP